MRIDMDGGTAVVTLGDGPNAFTAGFLTEANAALDEAEADPDVRAVVTTGAGRHYSNGFDLEFLGSLEGPALDAFLLDSRALLARVLTFPLPIAAALNGHAFGIGAMLALAHDRRVMRSDRGWFCLPEIDLGMRLHPSMTALIAARLPGATVHEAVLTGRRYGAADAVAAGITQAEAAEDDLVKATTGLLDPFGGKDRSLVAKLKRDLYAPVVALLET
jgi:enoyl-CoA hydratase/carnithine racemase